MTKTRYIGECNNCNHEDSINAISGNCPSCEDKEKKITIAPNHFADDLEKVDDFFCLDKEAFLKYYSYLTEEEYDNTDIELKKRGLLD